MWLQLSEWITLNRPKAWSCPNCKSIRKHDCIEVSSIWGLGSAIVEPKPAAIFCLCPTTNNSLALPRLQRLHNSQSIRMRGAILQITVNNNLPPSAPLPSLKQCFIAFFFHLHLSSPRSTVWSLPTSVCLPGVALTCWLAAAIRHMVGRGIDRSSPETKAD